MNSLIFISTYEATDIPEYFSNLSKVTQLVSGGTKLFGVLPTALTLTYICSPSELNAFKQICWFHLYFLVYYLEMLSLRVVL